MSTFTGYFSRDLYIQVEGKKAYKRNKEWVDICNGKTVYDENCLGYTILKKWTTKVRIGE